MKTVYLAILNSTDENEVLSVSESKQTAINAVKEQRKHELTEGYFSRYLTENTNINEKLTEDNFVMSVDLTDTDERFFVFDEYSDSYVEIYVKEMDLQN